MKKKIIWGIVIVSILVGGGFTYKSSNNTSMSDWKTYSNEKGGYEIKYPPSFDLTDGYIGDGFVLSSRINDNDVNSIFGKTDSSEYATSLPEYLSKHSIINPNNNEPFQFQKRVLGANTFYYAQTERFEGVLAFDYYILHNHTVYNFTSTSKGVDWTNPNLDVENDSTHATLKQILSTLKFTE